jgi:hypothetical protein
LSRRRARGLLAAGLAALVAAASHAEDAPAPAAETAAAPAAETAPATAPEAMPAPEAAELVRRAEAVLRGDGVFVEVSMRATGSGRRTPRLARFRIWLDARNERALLRVLDPPKRVGLAFLSLPPNLWRYAPRDASTTRIDPAARRGPWLGSDLTLEDVTSAESDALRYTHRLVRVDEAAGDGGASRRYVVESVPREGADVAWGRVMRWLDAEHGTPLREERYDAGGTLVSSIERSDLRDVAGRRYPYRWVARAHGENEGRETELRFDTVRFEAELSGDLFTTTALPPKE